MRSRRMVVLGEKGGRRGGPARARALTPVRRSAIASEAARARWSQPVLVFDRAPRDHAELLAFVAHYGARVAKTTAKLDLEEIALRAVEGSRRDPGMARMLPVFLWRVREDLRLDRLLAGARRRRSASALGYFLELAGRLGGHAGFDGALAKLRAFARPDRPSYFFRQTAKLPFAAMVAEQRTPLNARRWGLLTGTPTDSFATYFAKVRNL